MTTSDPAAAPADDFDDRRSQILRAALDVISHRGYSDTRVADVALRAGISPALVMYYFQTKDRLLVEATRLAEDLWYQHGNRRLEAIPSATARLEELVRLTCLPQEDPAMGESWAVWLDLWAQAAHWPEVAAVREEFDEHWRETIRALVRGGQADGEFDPVDVDYVAISLSAVLDGLAIQLALHDPVVTAQRAFDVAMMLAARLLGFSWQA